MPESRLYRPAPAGLQGEVTVPGDKSVSHRALLLGAVSECDVDVSGFLPSADTLATLAADQVSKYLAVERLSGTRTILLVAHRLSTLAGCDVVFRVERGRVVPDRDSRSHVRSPVAAAG